MSLWYLGGRKAAEKAEIGRVGVNWSRCGMVPESGCGLTKIGLAALLGVVLQPEPNVWHRRHRAMRALASRGVCAGSYRPFARTPMAEALRADSPATVRPVLMMLGHPAVWASRGQFVHAVETGRSGHELAHGATGFDYPAKIPTSPSAYTRR
ncbi:hypothetical protein ACQPZ2_10055 [Nocardia pseudovaccinii]|uniref:hypothetical protein n=1 Tax=Nocardia pseudovaccinii TaxID=189540 RepID=UPI003D8BD246